MNDFTLFLVEVFISLTAAGAVILFWSKSLRKILIDICGTEERAAFWLMYSNIMLAITPLLFVFMFGRSGEIITLDFQFLKRAFGSTLAGIFVALGVIGLQIAKFLPRQAPDENKI